MRHGCILRRPCFRHDKLPLAKAAFPAHKIWHRICLRVRTNDLLSPPFSAGSFLRDAEIQYNGRMLRIRPSILAPLFPQRATQELRVDGASDTRIKGAGFRRGFGARSYADTKLTDALKISRLVATAPPSDSEDDPDASAKVAFAESMRRRPMPFPAGELAHRARDICGGYRILLVFNIAVIYPGWKMGSAFLPGERSSRTYPRIP